jgi:hypothetical protein
MDKAFDRWKENLESRASQIEEKSATPPEFLEKEDVGPDDEIIANLEKEGWRLVDIMTNAYTVNAEDHPGKEIKIIGQGNRHLVFERDEGSFS